MTTGRTQSILERSVAVGRLFCHIVYRAYLHFSRSDGWAMSSHVAMSTLLALFPFLIFVVSFAGFFSGSVRGAEIVALTLEHWPPEIADPIARELDIVLSGANGGLLTVGIALAFFFASNGVEAVRVVLNRAYDETDERAVWKIRLQSFAFVLIFAVLLAACSVLLVIAPLYLAFIEVQSPMLYHSFFESEPLRYITTVLLLIFSVFACHYWLPVRRRRLRQIWPGIAMTIVFWGVAVKLFSLYLEMFANFGATYAGLAGVMTALVFLYVMAAILIFGAEFNAALENSKRGGIDL